MKRIAIILLFVVLIASCGIQEIEDTIETPIKIAALKGPTGMGMVNLMDMTDKYDITTYQAPDEIAGKVITGEVDMACLPSNMASVLYNKTGGQIVALTVETLGVLYILENGTDEIKELSDLSGKTIYGSGKGGTPEYILKKVFEKMEIEDVTVEWLSNHSDVASTFMAKEGSIALLPEPFVTVVTSKNENIRVALDVNNLWYGATGLDLPMGVLVCQRKFLEERGDDLLIFLRDYEESVNFVNENIKEAGEKIAQWGFIEDPLIASKSIKGSNIVFYSEPEISERMLKAFFVVLFEMDPQSIGGKLPDSGLYYGSD